MDESTQNTHSLVECKVYFKSKRIKYMCLGQSEKKNDLNGKSLKNRVLYTGSDSIDTKDIVLFSLDCDIGWSKP